MSGRWDRWGVARALGLGGIGVLCLAACEAPNVVPVDPGRGGVDAALRDGARPDLSSADQGPVEVGPVDAEALDADAVDAGPVDAEAVDAGPVDAADVPAPDWGPGLPDGDPRAVRRWWIGVRRALLALTDEELEREGPSYCSVLDERQCRGWDDGPSRVCRPLDPAQADRVSWAMRAAEWEWSHHRVERRSSVLTVAEGWLPRLAQEGCVSPHCVALEQAVAGPVPTAVAVESWVARLGVSWTAHDRARLATRVEDLLLYFRITGQPGVMAGSHGLVDSIGPWAATGTLDWLRADDPDVGRFHPAALLREVGAVDRTHLLQPVAQEGVVGMPASYGPALGGWPEGALSSPFRQEQDPVRLAVWSGALWREAAVPALLALGRGAEALGLDDPIAQEAVSQLRCFVHRLRPFELRNVRQRPEVLSLLLHGEGLPILDFADVPAEGPAAGPGPDRVVGFLMPTGIGPEPLPADCAVGGLDRAPRVVDLAAEDWALGVEALLGDTLLSHQHLVGPLFGVLPEAGGDPSDQVRETPLTPETSTFTLLPGLRGEDAAFLVALAGQVVRLSGGDARAEALLQLPVIDEQSALQRLQEARWASASIACRSGALEGATFEALRWLMEYTEPRVMVAFRQWLTGLLEARWDDPVATTRPALLIALLRASGLERRVPARSVRDAYRALFERALGQAEGFARRRRLRAELVDDPAHRCPTEEEMGACYRPRAFGNLELHRRALHGRFWWRGQGLEVIRPFVCPVIPVPGTFELPAPHNRPQLQDIFGHALLERAPLPPEDRLGFSLTYAEAHSTYVGEMPMAMPPWTQIWPMLDVATLFWTGIEQGVYWFNEPGIPLAWQAEPCEGE